MPMIAAAGAALGATVLAWLGARAAGRMVGERRRRAVLAAALAAEAGVPAEEHPRLKNGRRVERILSNRIHWTRIRHAPEPVVLRYRVTERGRTTEARVVRSSGSEAFDGAALRAIRHARFAPARVNGRAVQVWVEQPFTLRPPADGA